MSCDWTEKISLLVDGELAGDAARAALSHLEDCADCRGARADFLLFRRQLGSYSAQTSVAARRRALEAILSKTRPATPARAREESSAWPSRATWKERFAGAPFLSRLAPAAALLALVIVALGLFLYMYPRREAQTASGVPSGTPSRESAGATQSLTPRSEEPTVAVKEKDKGAGENPSEKRSALAALGSRPRNSPRVNARRRNAESAGALQTVAAATAPPSKSQRGAQPLANGGATTASIASASERARVAPLDAGRHVEQAQLLLRSFRNARLSDDDLAYERERSKKLLYRNIVLRREAASKGEAQVEGLLDRLEPILIDIANLPDKPAKEEVASIRERVRRKNLVVSLQAAAPRQKDF